MTTLSPQPKAVIQFTDIEHYHNVMRGLCDTIKTTTMAPQGSIDRDALFFTIELLELLLPEAPPPGTPAA